MKIRIVWVMPILFAGLIIYGCSPRSKYERILKHELASEVRYDSLFMEISLGMPEKDFYTHCWDLNREGLIKQGSNNTTVEHELKDELIYPATMNFYPEFFQDKIYEMPVRFLYKGWTPWNKNLSSDSLAADVLKWYEKVYGDGFIKVIHPKRGIAYVKVNGNRRITIFKEDGMHVWAIFTDMSVKHFVTDSISKARIIHEEIVKDLE